MKLFLAKLKWICGIDEFSSHKFVRARNTNEAQKKINNYLSDMWGNETERDDNWFAHSSGCPAVKCEGIASVGTLKEIVKEIGGAD